ncbi:MAG: hypothetical protein Q9227_008316 [Pyrenula ochraceoflavens]
MTDIMEAPKILTPDSKKRSHDRMTDDDVQKALGAIPASSLKEQSSIPTPSSGSVISSTSRQSSPVRGAVESGMHQDLHQNTASGSNTAPPSKKRKISPSEKLEKLRQREEREKQKAEEKARREVEKQIKAEEKRKRDEDKEAQKRKREFERAEKQKTKDEKQHAKEEKKRVEEEAKARKEKAQPKLSNFFRKPVASISPAESPVSSRRSSITGLGDTGLCSVPAAEPCPESSSKEREITDYEREFLPFYLSATTSMAPSPYQKDQEYVEHQRAVIDQALDCPEDAIETDLVEKTFKPFNPVQLFNLPFKRRRHFRCPQPIREMVTAAKIGSSKVPIDLTEDRGPQDQPSVQCNNTACKYLEFREDVRPPYIGTYTRTVSPRSARKLFVRPFSRALPETNYDYDSEAEWEPPQEGDEDIGSDEEDDASDDEDDMEGFLDDSNDSLQRQAVMSDMQPVSSGLCWEIDGGAPGASGPFDLNILRIQPLHPIDTTFPIDPHSTAYWPQPAHASSTSSSSMQPPLRPPLQSLHPNSPLSTSTSAPSDLSVHTTIDPSSKPKKLTLNSAKPIPYDVLAQFKNAIEGKTCTKVALVEALKEE